MRLAAPLLLSAALFSSCPLLAHGQVKVVASIKPVHSLVAAVMQGVGEPGLIVDGAASPHAYALKPSQAAMLQEADIVFWVGHELETFLEKSLDTIASAANSVELLDAPGLAKLEFREGGPFEKHEHGPEEDHEDHAHESGAADDHDHGGNGEADDDEDHHDHDEADHANGGFDSHVWLDPANAGVMTQEIARTLSAADPANADRYQANARAVSARLDELVAEVSADLETVKGRGFIVFHDAYQYFENRFGIAASGSITVSPEIMPGAERIGEIRKRIAESGVGCVFAEPQFEPRLVSTVTEGTQARAGILDPLGASLKDGPDLYFRLIRDLAGSMKACLSEAG